jgi:hypothetical protein
MRSEDNISLVAMELLFLPPRNSQRRPTADPAQHGCPPHHDDKQTRYRRLHVERFVLIVSAPLSRHAFGLSVIFATEAHSLSDQQSLFLHTR